MPQATLGDFLKRSEREKQQGVQVIDKVCKQLRKSGIKAWKEDDTYWGMGMRIGDRVLKVQLLQFKDYMQDVKRQEKQLYPTFTMRVSMQTLQSIQRLHFDDEQKAVQHFADIYKRSLLQQYKKYKEVR